MTAAARSLALQLLAPVLLVVGYQRWAAQADDPYFPTVPEIVSAFREMWVGEGFTNHVVPSLWNLGRGYALGLALGIGCGLLIGLHDRLGRVVAPIVAFCLTLPAVAVLPMFIIVLGIGSSLQVGIIVFAVFFTVLVNTADGVRAMDPGLHDVARSFGIAGARRTLAIVLPAAGPQILAAARTSVSVSLLVMVVSELVGASRGIGAATLLAQQDFQYARMWAGMVLLAVLGYVLNALFAVVERPLLRRLGVASGPTSRGAR